jgi:transposase
LVSPLEISDYLMNWFHRVTYLGSYVENHGRHFLYQFALFCKEISISKFLRLMKINKNSKIPEIPKTVKSFRNFEKILGVLDISGIFENRAPVLLI